MVTSSRLTLDKLRLDILPSDTRKAFLRCTELPFLKNDGWYLAGGTALALQAGHRRSVDLDFFTHLENFDSKKIEEEFAKAGLWTTDSLDRGTLYGQFLGAKISLIAYPFFSPNDSFVEAGAVSVLSPADISVMKIIAISQRGKKRDFYDLYWLCLNILPLEKILKRMEDQYSIHQNFTHILKSLVYFGDAESDPEPEIFFDADWETVKSFFVKEIKVIAEKLIR